MFSSIAFANHRRFILRDLLSFANDFFARVCSNLSWAYPNGPRTTPTSTHAPLLFSFLYLMGRAKGYLCHLFKYSLRCFVFVSNLPPYTSFPVRSKSLLFEEKHQNCSFSFPQPTKILPFLKIMVSSSIIPTIVTRVYVDRFIKMEENIACLLSVGESSDFEGSGAPGFVLGHS